MSTRSVAHASRAAHAIATTAPSLPLAPATPGHRATLALMTAQRRPTNVVLDAYVLDTLMPDLVGHDGRPSALLVYVYLWHQAAVRRAPTTVASLRQIAEGTGLSKRTVQAAVRHLMRRRLLGVHRERPTAVPRYEPLRPWKRRPR